MSAVRIFRPAYVIDELGELGRLPDGAITNMGGTEGPYFTVGGRPLMFADGTPTTPTPGGGVSLQTTYDNSLSGNIDLSTGKSWTFTALNGNRFTFNADTGEVTIDGDLAVLGSSTVIEGTIQNVDQLNISNPAAGLPGFTLQPAIGITPTSNLLEVRNIFGGATVFSINSAGTTSLANLLVSGTINGVDINALQTDLATHLSTLPTPPKHAASQISANTAGLVNVSGSTVQEVIESIDVALNSAGGSVQGVEYIVPSDAPAPIWNIVHNRNSRRVQVTIWDQSDNQIFADTTTIVDANTVRIVWNTPATGRAILMIF